MVLFTFKHFVSVVNVDLQRNTFKLRQFFKTLPYIFITLGYFFLNGRIIGILKPQQITPDKQIVFVLC